MSHRMELDRRAVLAGLAMTPSCIVNAQAPGTYPNKTIKVLVGVPPGGSTDMTTRLFAQFLQDELGQTTVVENRPGANTSIAALAVAQAMPDGHTILVSSDAYIIVPLLTKTLPYDPVKSISPVGTMTISPFLTVVHPSVPVTTLKELIAYAKANPGKLHYASSGNGSASHIGCEKFKKLTGTDIVHVPYRGAGPALVDALSGQVQMASWTPLAAANYVASGRLRAIAITGDTRLKSLPDVPTFAEAGLPEYRHQAWMGVFVTANTPRPVIDKLNSVLAKMVTVPAIKQKLDENGVLPFLNTPEQFAALMQKETGELEQIVKAMNVKAD